MNALASAGNWLAKNVRPNINDFNSEEPPPPPDQSDSVLLNREVAIGAGAGTLVGAGLAYADIANDKIRFDHESYQVPRAELAPGAAEVFGADLGRFTSLIRNHSDNRASAESSLQYLANLKHLAPKTSEAELSGVYRALENQFSDDGQVRKALNLIGAHMEKHETTPGQAYYEFSRHFQFETDFERGSQTFMEASKISDWEVNETVIQLVKRHSSFLGHLGMLKGVALGAGAGLVAGVAVGAVAHAVLKED